MASNKILCIVRATNESTLNDCIGQLKQLKFDVKINHNQKPLEQKVKDEIRIGAEVANEYDWLMIVAADVIITQSKSFIENICEEMSKQNMFFFYCAAMQTWGNKVCVGVPFYNTKLCGKAHELIKDGDFNINPPRAETLITTFLKENGFAVMEPRRGNKILGIHLWFVNNQEKDRLQNPSWTRL